MKASFIVAEDLAKSSRPFSELEFLKSCLMKVCDFLYPDKRQMFGTVSVSRNAIADHICEMATDLRAQLVESSRDFIAYSLAVDKSKNFEVTAKLAIFIRGGDSNTCVKDEMLDFKSLQGTKAGKDFLQCVSKCSRHESALAQTYWTYSRWSTSDVWWTK